MTFQEKCLLSLQSPTNLAKMFHKNIIDALNNNTYIIYTIFITFLVKMVMPKKVLDIEYLLNDEKYCRKPNYQEKRVHALKGSTLHYPKQSLLHPVTKTPVWCVNCNELVCSHYWGTCFLQRQGILSQD